MIPIPVKKPKRKYRNTVTSLIHKGEKVRFDSKAELARFTHLHQLEQAGVISDLELQPEYLLQQGFKRNGKTHRAVHYLADFRYQKNGQTIVEDVKGMKNTVYLLKRKLFLAQYGQDLRFIEVTYKNRRFTEVEV